jgi:aryl-alcohol dehydrogenase-like predicted oxidoreductase
MKYRLLGRTDLKISEIGFGCGNTGGLMVHGSAGEQLRAVRHALDRGINYFDTAVAYGDGKSEINLGRVLNEAGAEVVIATKVRLRPEDLADLKAATIASVEQSLQRLGRKSVHLIQLHTRVALRRKGRRFTLRPAEVLGPNGVLAGFQALRDTGKVRYFGFSGLGDPQALHALIDSGEFNSVQAYYNLLNPSAGQPVPPGFGALDYGQVIDRAAARGMGAVVIRVLAAGALTEAVPARDESSEPLSPGSDYALDIARARKLRFLVDGNDIKSLSQAAIRFALMKPEVSTVLVGFSNVSHIDHAVACSGAGGLSDEALARLERLWETDFGNAAEAEDEA